MIFLFYSNYRAASRRVFSGFISVRPDTGDTKRLPKGNRRRTPPGTDCTYIIVSSGGFCKFLE
ncbi:hypothetical protein HMPREF1548_03788 [Clostridium sp. KLE 1755]|nr:hypothetical protein HMPREF1548_03788 [Clostridium sp. KLE 1755]